MWKWDTLTSNHQGGTQTRWTAVSQGEELNTFNLNSRSILIIIRWDTSTVTFRNTFSKVYVLLIISSKLAAPSRWPSGSHVISLATLSQ